MTLVESAMLDMGGLDTLAMQDTPVHRRDPRAKVVVTLCFILTAISFGKYEVAALLPLLAFPIAIAAAGNIPPRHVLRKLAVASPFAILVGLFNPIIDRTIVFDAGWLHVSAGWISYASILLRFALTLSAALLLVATTGFGSVCAALRRLGCPKVLTTQFLLLYRYVYVLADEAALMFRAWSLRANDRRRMPARTFASLIGHLLVRALDRSQRLHMAMIGRGFDGEFRTLRTLRFGAADAVFVAAWCAFFILARLCNLPHLLGTAATGFHS